MRLSIQLEMPPPEKSRRVPEPMSIEDKVRDAVELCESGYCSDVEWRMLCRLRDALREKKQTPRIQNLLQMIQPILNKYGYHDTVSAIEEDK